MRRLSLVGFMVLDQYELVELISQHADGKTFKAREVSTSRDVIVHALKSPDLAELAKSLSDRGHAAEVLFIGEQDRTSYIVTESRAECHEIRKWLQQRSDDPLGRAGPWKIPVPQAAAPPKPGEFTQLFQPGPPNPKQPQVPKPPAAEAGEFTRMFSTSTESPDATPAVSRPAGDFTRMFQSPQETALPSKPGGQFTQLFKAPVPAQDTPENHETEPGGFTRLFRTAPSDQEMLPPAAYTDPLIVASQPVTNPAATGIFTNPVSAAPVTVDQQPSGPSDFTRVIAIPTAPAAEPANAAPAPPVPETVRPSSAPVQPTTPSYLVPILVLSGLFLLAVLLVLYFAFKN